MDELIKEQVPKVKTMLEYHKSTINPNKKNKEGKTALMLLCSYDVQMYMNNATKQGARTVLNLVDILLNLGADVNMKDNEGYTALMLASKYVHPLLVDRLLATNRVSDINERTNNSFLLLKGLTALDLANDDSNKYRKSVDNEAEGDPDYKLNIRQKYVVETLKRAMGEKEPVRDGSRKRRRKADGGRRSPLRR